MARDDTKLAYYSGWEIDQLITTNTVSVSSGTTLIYSFTGTIPLFDVQYQKGGSGPWYGMGLSSTDGTFANTFTFYAKASSSAVSVITPAAGNVRYFVWSDQVVY